MLTYFSVIIAGNTGRPSGDGLRPRVGARCTARTADGARERREFFAAPYAQWRGPGRRAGAWPSGAGVHARSAEPAAAIAVVAVAVVVGQLIARNTSGRRIAHDTPRTTRVRRPQTTINNHFYYSLPPFPHERYCTRSVRERR